MGFVPARTKPHRLKRVLLKPPYALALLRNSVESRSSARSTEEIRSFNCSRFVALTMGAVMLGRPSSHAREILAGVAWYFFAIWSRAPKILKPRSLRYLATLRA